MLIINLDYVIDIIEDKLVLRVSWRTIDIRFNCYNLSAIFMNSPRYFSLNVTLTVKTTGLGAPSKINGS